MRFTGKSAIVTGAGSGIGRATAIKLASEGANLMLIDINSDTCNGTAQTIHDFGGKVICEIADVRDKKRVDEIVKRTANEFTTLDILVNNAGGSARLINKQTLFADSVPETWEWVIGVNLIAPMLLIHAVIPYMIEAKDGKIINVGSVAGVNGLSSLVDYSAAKGGVISLTRALAIELGEHGINVNCVSPGSVASRPGQPITYLGRSGLPEEVASLISFLASSDASFITGQNYVIDGGRCLSTNCSKDIQRK